MSRFVVSVSVTWVESTGEWWMDILFGNRGPASSIPFRVNLKTGSRGVSPRAPESSIGEVEPGFQSITLSEGPDSCFEANYAIRILEPLLPGDTFRVSQTFDVHPERSSELLQSSEFRTGSTGFAGTHRQGKFVTTFEGDSGTDSVVAQFVQSIEMRGSNVDQNDFWDGGELPSPRAPC